MCITFGSFVPNFEGSYITKIGDAPVYVPLLSRTPLLPSILFPLLSPPRDMLSRKMRRIPPPLVTSTLCSFMLGSLVPLSPCLLSMSNPQASQVPHSLMTSWSMKLVSCLTLSPLCPTTITSLLYDSLDDLCLSLPLSLPFLSLVSTDINLLPRDWIWLDDWQRMCVEEIHRLQSSEAHQLGWLGQNPRGTEFMLQFANMVQKKVMVGTSVPNPQANENPSTYRKHY